MNPFTKAIREAEAFADARYQAGYEEARARFCGPNDPCPPPPPFEPFGMSANVGLRANAVHQELTKLACDIQNWRGGGTYTENHDLAVVFMLRVEQRRATQEVRDEVRRVGATARDATDRVSDTVANLRIELATLREEMRMHLSPAAPLKWDGTPVDAEHIKQSVSKLKRKATTKKKASKKPR